jgi:hypothetical protein
MIHTPIKVSEDAKSISGEVAAEDIVNPATGEVIVRPARR